MPLSPFHLAFPIKSIADTRAFYIDILGCNEGRSTEAWIDFDFFGHQLSAHVRPEAGQNAGAGNVDGDAVPIPHFGAVLEWDKWHDLADRLKEAGLNSCWSRKSALKMNRANRELSLWKTRPAMVWNSRHSAIRR